MKWIGGIVLSIITIILLIMAMFIFPWFGTKTEYWRERINEVRPEYWDEGLGGIERDWDESTYYLQEYELKSSAKQDWLRTNVSNATSSGTLEYNAAPKEGGWEGSYYEMMDANYPVPGFLAGGNEQLNVYNNTYYMVLLAIILSIIGIIFIIIAGLGKINPTIPKVLVGIAVIFTVLAPIYFALALPMAIETDDEELQNIKGTNNESPPEGGGQIMGNANERDKLEGVTLASIDWAPELGWWFSVGAIFTSIVTIAFITGGKSEPERVSRDMRRKYHEFDRQSEYDDRRDYDEEYIPPTRRQRSDGYYEEESGGRRREPYDYERGGRPRPGPREPPQRSRYDYGRPTPRPPRKGR